MDTVSKTTPLTIWKERVYRMKKRTEQDQHFDVGGQAVMEGVMMRSPSATAVTVRYMKNTEI